MAKLPTYEEMAKNVAEKALDDVLYNGKSIREWMQIIVSEDCISRAQALSDYADWYGYGYRDNTFYKRLKDMSPVTPKPKTGHWILADEQNKEDVENDNYRFICSKCQCSDVHAKGTIVPYCWKCGTKMVEQKVRNKE